MASHTLTDNEITEYNVKKKQKITNLTHSNIQDHAIIMEQKNVLRNVEKMSDVAHEDLEGIIKHHDIGGSVQNLPIRNSYQKKELTAQAQGVKTTTIDLVGGIFCHICKLTYSNKKTFDDHYVRHSSGKKLVYTCVVCYREFNNYPSFRGHCYTNHVIKDRNKCEFCSKCFSKITSLRDHINTIHSFKCSTCSKQFSSKTELMLHQVIHNKSKAPPYHCQFCEVLIPTLESCKDHADFHTVIIYTCPICNENISSRDNASDHLLKHFDSFEESPSIAVIQNSDKLETSVEGLGGIACGYCSVVSKNRVEFDAHFSYEHEDEDIEYICVICDKSFEKYSVFANHAYNHRVKDRFCCSICLKSFCRLSMLATHMAACNADPQASGKPFACSECGHRYATEKRLRRHMLDAHGICCLTCPVEHCQESFTTPKQLILHQKIHDTNQNWCRQCSLPFPSLESCSQHLEVHKKILFVCPVCNKHYRERHMLVNHLAQHYTSVLHICKVCGKVYDNRRNFMDHLKTHSEKNVHRCSYCEKRFVKLHQLQEHLNIHTGSKPYKCSVCSRMFASFSNWSKHKRRMHNLQGALNPTSDNDEIYYSESVDEEECIQNDIIYSSSHNSEGLAKINPQINKTDVKLNYVYQVQESGGMETQIVDSIGQVQDTAKSNAELATIDCIDQVEHGNLEAESIMHIDIEKELKNLENIPDSQNNENNKFVDVFIDETQIVNSIDQVQDTVLSNAKLATIDCIDQVEHSNMEAESIMHIDIEKELKTLQNIPGNQNHVNNKFVDVLIDETHIVDSIGQVQDATMSTVVPGTIDRIEQVEVESIIHIDIEKELITLENIQDSQNNENSKFVDVFIDETIFDNVPAVSAEVPLNTVSSKSANFPLEYGPEFTLGNSYGFLDLEDHMLPHIDPLLTIKTEEFNHNLPLPDLNGITYQVPSKWEPPIFTKVSPEYPYGFGDMVDSNWLSMMNTDIF